MSTDCHFILAVVDGSSESRGTSHYPERPCNGALIRILSSICSAYGDKIGSHVSVRYWRESAPRSHCRPVEKKLFGYAEKVAQWIRLARVTNQYAMLIFLVDNDRFPDTPSRREQLETGVTAGMKQQEAPHRPLVVDGVAVEMIESWLLADPKLVEPTSGLPRGKQAEDFWGDERDPDSHHPKCLLARHVCTPRRFNHADCIEHWDIESAAQHSPSLKAFLSKLQDAARQLGLC